MSYNFVPVNIRKKIVRMYEEGYSFSEISAETDVIPSTAKPICMRYKETGSYLPLPRTGPPKVISPRQLAQIKAEIIQCPCITYVELKAKLKLTCSPVSICRAIKRHPELAAIKKKGYRHKEIGLSKLISPQQFDQMKSEIKICPYITNAELKAKLKLSCSTMTISKTIKRHPELAAIKKTAKIKLTPERMRLVRAEIERHSDITAEQLIEKLNLPITSEYLRSCVCKEFRIVIKAAENRKLTEEHFEQIRLELQKDPKIPILEINRRLGYPVSYMVFRRHVKKMGLR